MSRAYKCDRCGALYESYEGENRYDVLKPTKVMINSLAEDILNVYDISVPIQNIGDIVEILGGTIQKETSFSDGAVEKEGDGFRIIVSPYQDEKRERFTIAHELGHLFLHMGYRTNKELWARQENKAGKTRRMTFIIE